ncbi:MAG: hypothetical protein N3A62_05135 [Thermodesulfovibrionales bacterium]|nr:hypothetical protein [Thermodesulfovibrionales bacterium]
MDKKNVLVCVKKDILHPIGWALREFEKMVIVKYVDNTKQIDDLLEAGISFCVLIIDSILQDKSTFEYIKSLKERHKHQRILYIVSEGSNKEDIIELIRSKIVSGVLIRPFTAEQMSDYIYKLCGFQKPTEVPWYMQTGIK